jgi:Pyruvate flavodoxin/ferredoxin oxidoreductase, thiamine diP-bdg
VKAIVASPSAEEARSLDPPYPGIPAIVDGSKAAAHVESRLAEVACVYPITPSTTMAAIYQAAVAAGKSDLWGTPLAYIEPESEHSSASAAEGVALAGGRVTNFTAGQGLVLMKEVLYVIAGKRLPVVFHVGARSLTSQALNIHAGHDDLMAVADTDLQIRMQGVALVGVFLRVSPFARAAGLGRDEQLDQVRMRLGRFFGKRGTAVVDANLAIIAEAYDGLIDVTGALDRSAASAEGAVP